MTARHSAADLASRLGDAHAPTPQQAAAIEAPMRPMLLVAGAGSGKTATMAARVVWLIANGHVRPDQVLGLTFTRKAAGELARRIRQRLARLRAGPDAALAEPTVSTYHAYASGIVSEYGLRIGAEPQSTVLSPTAAWQTAYAAVRAYDGDMSSTIASADTVTKRVLSLSDEMSEHLQDADTVRDFTHELLAEIAERVGTGTTATRKLVGDLRSRLQLLPIVEEYRRRKRAAGAVDFADQLAQAATIARAAPEVGRTERSRYSVVLLDEYQDTSHAQVALLQALFGDGHPVTAVGDPCQSIYAWRGASAGTLPRFRTDFPDSDEPAAVAELTTSWRNTAPILGAANAVSQPLRAAGLAVPALLPGVDADGRVHAALLDTADAEAEWVAAEISTLWKESGWRPDAIEAQSQSQVDNVTPPTTAVLVRRRTQISTIESALRAAGLPVEVLGAGGLLDAPEVREMYSVLTVLAQPTSGPALLRLLTGPRWRIGPRDLAALYARARELAPQSRGFEPSADGLEEATLAEALDDPGSPQQYSQAAFTRFAELRAELAHLRSRADQPLADLVAEIATVTGLEVEATVHQGDAERLSVFADEASRYQANASFPNLDGFLSYLDAAEERERGLALTGATIRSGAVQVMTVHAAKGLEWDCVAVPGLCDGMFPGSSADANWLKHPGRLPYPLRGDAVELPQLDIREVAKSKALNDALSAYDKAVKSHHHTEERRLAYVALTRAKTTLLASGYWWGAGASNSRGPSVILEEVREACTQCDVWAAEPADNPMGAHPEQVWPSQAPLGDKQEPMLAAAKAVREHHGEVVDSPQSLQWAAEVDMLLAERDAAAAEGVAVARPAQLSVSQLTAWHADSQEFARRLRRPMPSRPAAHSRRGTAFHAWVERRLGGAALFELDELPGVEDSPEPDVELHELQAAFESSQWANRTPVALEVPFTTVLEGVVVRGRIDAVFAADDGFEVVDWKTGRVPHGANAEAAAVQLAAYRQAWAALRGVDVSQVRASFHYVRQNKTVRPVDLPSLGELAEPLHDS